MRATRPAVPSTPRSPKSGKRRTPRETLEQRLLALRERVRSDGGDRLVVATLRIRLAQNHWLGKFSTAHPEVRIEAQHRTGIDARTSVLDYGISGLPPGRWTKEIASYPDVRRVEALAEIEDGCLYRIVQRTLPIVKIYRRLGLPLKFPQTVLAGTITWEVVARKADFEKLMVFFRRQKLQVKITSIRRGLLRDRFPVLSATQQLLLTEALRLGYFAVPREITLTDLAKRLGRSKSAVSESLVIVERKLLESAMRPVRLAPP